MQQVSVDSDAVALAPARPVDHVEPARLAAVRADAWFMIGALVALVPVAVFLTSPTVTAVLAVPAGIGVWRAVRRLRAPEHWAEPDVDAVAREILHAGSVAEIPKEGEEDSLSLRLRIQDQIDALESDPEGRSWRRGRTLGVVVASGLLMLSLMFGIPWPWSAALAGILATYLAADLLIARPRRRRIRDAVQRLRAESLTLMTPPSSCWSDGIEAESL